MNKLILSSLLVISSIGCDQPTDQTSGEVVLVPDAGVPDAAPDREFKYFCDYFVPLASADCARQQECGQIEDYDGCVQFWVDFSAWRCNTPLTKDDSFYSSCIEQTRHVACDQMMPEACADVF